MKYESLTLLRPVLTALFLVCVLRVEITNSANILSLVFVSGRSQSMAFDPMFLRLASLGHNLTMVSPFNLNHPNIKVITPYDFETQKEEIEKQMPTFFEMKSRFGWLMPLSNLYALGMFLAKPACEKVYTSEQVQSIIRKKEKFDLIFVNAFMNECAYGMAYYLEAPIVILSPIVTFPFMAEQLGSPTPNSFVPLPLYGQTDKMDFWGRLGNLAGSLWLQAGRNWYYSPQMEKMYREHVHPSLPSVREIERNASLILSNSHFSINYPRPQMPDIVDVGGMHCRSPNPLPKEIENFLNDSKPHGFILFSMGSNLKASTMPESVRQTFVRTFARLKQRVLWKWEAETMDDLPNNVMLSKWLPQQDVLGHSQVRLFLTHGGFHSTEEAVYHGVPLVGIPMMGDQQWNMRQAEEHEFAILLEYTELTEETLFAAIQRVLTEIKFTERAKALSAIFRDQPNDPLSRAVYWTEYIIKHRGATHLRSPARDLNFWQYHSIDVVALVSLIVFFVLFLSYLVMRAVVRVICSCFASNRLPARQKSSKETKKHK